MPALPNHSPDRRADDDFEKIRTLVLADRKVLVVLDDDPTGTQTVHGVTVLTEWSEAILAAELSGSGRCFYILTNSRAMPKAAAVALNREIARNLAAAAAKARRDFVIVSRSDSTLRGHFPSETDALAEELADRFDGVVLMPAFPEGGRVTIHGTHYVSMSGVLTPVAETEFARDPTFGFRHSNLKQWVREKTEGRVAVADVGHISLELLRSPNAAADVCTTLLQLPPGRIVAVDAVTYGDIAAFVHGLLLAESTGRRYLARTAASYVRVRAAITPRPYLTSAELGLAPDRNHRSGLIVVGSYVDKTTRQLEHAFGLRGVDPTEIDVDRLLEPTTRDPEITRVAHAANAAIIRGQHALVYTSRKSISARGRAGELPIAECVSTALVAVVQRIQARPQFIVAKGGITSSDLATRALGVKRAQVLGQAAAGIPVWRLGSESRFPGLPYVVFPGNVGEADTLRRIIELLS